MKIKILELRRLIREELDRFLRRSAGIASGINTQNLPNIQEPDLTVPQETDFSTKEEKEKEADERQG